MNIRDYLMRSRDLVELTSQAGWIDNETLRFEVVERDAESVTTSVHFDEVLMEGSGCPAGRVSCWGKVRFELDDQGEVRSAEVL